jgi:hypothetical protein
MPLASDAAHSRALKLGCETLARMAWKITTAMPSEKIPPTIRAVVRGGIGYVNAGGPGGKEAPNAAMFETLNARHPLFAHGPRGTDGWRHWYVQPYRPFLEEAWEVAGQDACDVYADNLIAAWKAENRLLHP